ncbi:hypothetical protein BOX17_16095 [Halomonas aestuarii]|uniref:Uncharacterized protein n=1 Tax=Halomonas aestuarii TaxID=1897729 RepID=A0A1J0VJY8_9GAMM|nr:DUF6482 family protein [Halomonas aestuarii]APE32344.1 hypothetical protein BOX17_16095 [Halomonas aestuarii]
MSATTSALPDRVTLEELADWLQAGLSPTVEVQSIDQGYYLVRLHHGHGISQLVDEDRKTRRFTGTQWVSRALLPLGITHGILTWAEVTDEMIGLPETATDPASVLAHGTRLAFQTR